MQHNPPAPNSRPFVRIDYARGAFAGAVFAVVFIVVAAARLFGDDPADSPPTNSSRPPQIRSIVASPAIDSPPAGQAAANADPFTDNATNNPTLIPPPPSKIGGAAATTGRTAPISQTNSLLPDGADSGPRPGSIRLPYVDPPAAANEAGPRTPGSTPPGSATGLLPGNAASGSSPELLTTPEWAVQSKRQRLQLSPHTVCCPGLQWPHEYLRDHGWGEPAVGDGWGNRPLEFGFFLGAMRGSEMIAHRLNENTGFLGGGRLGWDFDPHWGIEARFGVASMQTEWQVPPFLETSERIVISDTSMLFYPWGDARFRPFFQMGLGLQEFTFTDDQAETRSRGLLEMPIGIGWKYRIDSALALRIDILDNVAFGSSGLETMHNWSFCTGLEFHFGGSHLSYWPWNPAGF